MTIQRQFTLIQKVYDFACGVAGYRPSSLAYNNDYKTKNYEKMENEHKKQKITIRKIKNTVENEDNKFNNVPRSKRSVRKNSKTNNNRNVNVELTDYSANDFKTVRIIDNENTVHQLRIYHKKVLPYKKYSSEIAQKEEKMVKTIIDNKYVTYLMPTDMVWGIEFIYKTCFLDIEIEQQEEMLSYIDKLPFEVRPIYAILTNLLKLDVPTQLKVSTAISDRIIDWLTSTSVKYLTYRIPTYTVASKTMLKRRIEFTRCDDMILILPQTIARHKMLQIVQDVQTRQFYVVYSTVDKISYYHKVEIRSNRIVIDPAMEEDAKYFRVKRASMEGLKTNVWATRVMSGIMRAAPTYYNYMKDKLSDFVTATNDQVCSYILAWIS